MTSRPQLLGEGDGVVKALATYREPARYVQVEYIAPQLGRVAEQMMRSYIIGVDQAASIGARVSA